MIYNVDFLYAGLFLMALVLGHKALFHASMADRAGSFFNRILIVAALDCLADIIASYLIEHSASVPLPILYTSDILLYLVQIVLPFLVLVYTNALATRMSRGRIGYSTWSCVPLLITSLLIISTPLTGLVYSFDPSTHAYSYGLLQPVGYVCALVYVVLGSANIFRKRRLLRPDDLRSLSLFIVLVVAFTLLQAAVPHLSTSGFGAALGVTLLYFNSIDPSGQVDQKTQTLDATEFRRRWHAMQAGDESPEFSLLFIVIENLNQLNALSGSQAGDAMLAEVARLLREESPLGRVYRIKGSRFIIVAYNIEQGHDLRNRIDALNGRILSKTGVNYRLTLRTSLLEHGEECESPEEAEGYFDFLVNALRARKSDDQLTAMASLESYRSYHEDSKFLERAMEMDLFEIALQPIYSTRKRSITSLEVLSRLNDPQRGSINPQTFISIAETNGAIGQISEMQFNRLCRFLASHKDLLAAAGIDDVKFNLSGQQVSDPTLADWLISGIESHGLDPALFSFEVTETVATQNPDMLRSLIMALHLSGCRVCLDDFGSGYANLDIVVSMPFDMVKFDITLLRGMREDSRKTLLYRNLVQLMHGQGLKVVSEGVEDAQDADHLDLWGVDYLQGYHFSRPLTAGQTVAFLREQAER